MADIKKVAVVYQTAPIYREALFKRLFGRSGERFEFTLFAGAGARESNIRLLDPALANRPLSEGGLRWHFVKNLWMGHFLIQPYILLLPFQRRWEAVIFLGNAYYITTWIAAILCRLSGKKVLFWTHGYRSRPQSRVVGFAKNLFFHIADGLILYGQRAREILEGEGFSGKRLFVAYNSLDYEHHQQLLFAAKAKPLASVARQSQTCIWIGRFIDGKELPVLLRAFAVLRQSRESARLVLIGEGPEQEAMMALAEELNLSDSVDFPGPIFDQEVLAEHLMQADLAVSPGAVGVFAVLAHTFGLPVMTHSDWSVQGPEAEIIVPGVTGEFFTRGDTAGLANMLDLWLSDPLRLKEARAKCMEQVSAHYTPEQQQRAIENAINQSMLKS
jgi:glycosyltransferase involved in cell wall biosynthesis